MAEDEDEIPSVTGDIAAGRDVFAAGRDIYVNAPMSYDSYVRKIKASSRDVGYEVFWSGSDDDRICALNGEISPDEAAAFIARRASGEHGAPVRECADLLYSLNRGNARAILRLDDKLAGKVLPAFGGGLAKFLAEVSAQSVPDGAHFVYLVVIEEQFRDSARILFAADSVSSWRTAWISALEPDRAARLLSAVGAPWPGTLLPGVTPIHAARIILSDSGSGRWLGLISDPDRSAAVLAEAARADPVGLARRILQNGSPVAVNLVTTMKQAPATFHPFLIALPEWHLVVFAAMSELAFQPGEALRDRMRAIVGIWPWLAGWRAVRATAPNSGRIGIWWKVRVAAATWTADCKEQRQRDVRMFIAGAAVTLAVWIAFAIL